MLLKIIFAHLLGMGIVTPMGETNDDRDLYNLYVIKEEAEEVFSYEHVYEEEILNYIYTNEFKYNECFRLVEDKIIEDCYSVPIKSVLTKNK
tara:strand:- start:1286 stop:1561 length:276 start_codon:yes stop_codon:yes gene_type:complete